MAVLGRVVTVLLLVVGVTANGYCTFANQQLLFRHLNSSHGLTQNSVREILQDRNGYMWFGTENGVSRYDGYEFFNIYHDPDQAEGLSHQAVFVILEDRDGMLWFGTDKGLNRFDPRTEQFKHYFADQGSNLISGNSVQALAEIGDELWVGTLTGLSIIDLNSGESKKISIAGRHDLEVWSIAEDQDGGVWLATINGGVWYQEKNNAQWHSYQLSDNPQAEANMVRKVLLDGDTVWLGTVSGLARLSRHSGQVEFIDIDHQYPPNVFDLVKYQGHLWIASYGGGVYRFNIASKDTDHYMQNMYDPYAISSNYVLKLYLDPNERLWVGSQAGGVDYDNLFSNVHLYRHVPGQKNALPAENVTAVLEMNHNELVFGTDAGVSVYKRDDNTFRHYDIGHVIGLYASPFGETWVAASEGVFQIKTDGVKRVSSILQTYVLTLLQLDPDTLLMGTSYGLWLWNKKSQSETKIKMPQDEIPFSKSSAIEFLFRRSNGDILIATQAGIYELNLKEFKVVPGVGPLQQFKDKSVVYIFEDVKQHLWVGTNSQGVYKLDESRVLEQYRRAHGMPDNAGRGIIESDGVIWVSTDRGIVSIEGGKVSQYKQRFFNGEFNSGGVHRLRDGSLLFAGVFGAIMFDPKDLQYVGDKLPIVISDFKLFNRSQRPGAGVLQATMGYQEALILRHDQNIFSLDFSAFDYDQQGLLYAYRMTGFQEDDWVWVDSNNRRATFTSLEAGDYVFEVKAGLNQKSWSQEIARVQIKVLPPWWQTPLAYASYILFVVTLIVLYIRLHTYRLKKRALHLERLVDERIQETQAQSATIERLLDKKNEMFANISHELRTPITLIAGPVDQVLETAKDNQQSKMLLLAQKNIKRLNILVDQLLQLSRLYYVTDEEKCPQCLSSIAEAIAISFQNIGELKNISLTADVEADIWVEAIPNAMDSLLINLLSNAFKYTEPGGSIKVELKRAGEDIQLEVRDTGVGIPKDQLENIFERFTRLESSASPQADGVGIGLALVKQLLELHSGSIHVQSEETIGSSFTVTLPIFEKQMAEQQGVKAVLSDNASRQLSDIAALYVERSVAPEGIGLSYQSDHQDREKPSLLIIDDTQDMRTYLNEILSNAFSCLLASSGEEGLEIAREQIPDIILCDVMMPGMDGFEVLDKIRDDERSSHIPILMLTAKGDRESKIKGWAKLADDYIVKPFDAVELQARLGAVLEIRKLQQQQLNTLLQTKGPNDKQLRSNVSPRDQKFLEKLHEVIQRHYSNPELRLEKLASQIHLSDRALQYKTKALLGKSPKEYLREYRLMRAVELLQCENLDGDELADRVGFSSREYFSKCFKAHTGKTLNEYRQALCIVS